MTSLQAVKYSTKINKQPQALKKIFVAGVGAVGNTLVKQISKQPTLRILGVCNSRNVLWFDQTSKEYSQIDLKRAPRKDWDQIIRKLTSYEKGTIVFVDATGNSETANLYPQLLSEGIHVVTPSKLANTQSQEQFDLLHETAKKNEASFLYETNVGAGLPVIGTIKSLIESGDKILAINGVVSGTMTYLFSQLDKGEPFSKTVIQARTLGYAEPDPRDDLSGEDVARKFLILARICGLKIERDQIDVESLIPESLKDVDATTFLSRLKEVDQEWQLRLETEKKNGRTLRYVGKLDDGKIKVGIQPIPMDSPTGRLTGTNNLIEIKTRRYLDQPLIIQGPGAGKEVTAAGVLTDILKIR